MPGSVYLEKENIFPKRFLSIEHRLQVYKSILVREIGPGLATIQFEQQPF